MSETSEGNDDGSHQQVHPCTCGFACGRGLHGRQRSGNLQLNSASPTPSSSSSVDSGAAAVLPLFREARVLGDSGRRRDLKFPSASHGASQGARSFRESIRNGDEDPASSPSPNATSSFPGERSLGEGRKSRVFQHARASSTTEAPSSRVSKGLRERSSSDSPRNGNVEQAATPEAPAVTSSPSGLGEKSLRSGIGGGDTQLVPPSFDVSPAFHRARSVRGSLRIGDLQQPKSPPILSPSRASPAVAPSYSHRWGRLGENVTSGGPQANSAAPGVASTFPSPATLLTPLSTSTSIKSKLAAGHKLYGAFLVSFSTVVAEILGWAGYDFVVVDLAQLFPGDNFAALPVLQALASTGTPAIFRLAGNDPVLVNKALDMGPAGLMFSMIENEEAARNAVALCKYPPDGIRRGSRHVVSRASHYGLDPSYMRRYEEELFVICQVETPEAFDNIMEIAGVEGVHCIHMGGLDIGARLGDPYLDYNTRLLFCHAEEKILLRRGQVFLAGLANPESSPDSLFKRGYDIVSGAMDVVLLRDAAVADLQRNKPPSGSNLAAFGRK